MHYVELLEQGGLDSANARVTFLFDEFKQSTDVASRQTFADQLNDLFYRAIYIFPHLAYSIEIKLDPQFASSDHLSKIWGSLGCDINRGSFLANAVVDSTANLPLPYGFSTGVHGSGERSAVASSLKSILFGLASTKLHEPIVQIMLSNESPRNPTFRLDEIESLKFTTQEKRTPLAEANRPPRQQPGAVSSYLHFRNFGFEFNDPKLANHSWNFLATKFHDNLRRLGYFAKLTPGSESAQKTLSDLTLLNSDEIQLLLFNPKDLPSEYNNDELSAFIQNNQPLQTFTGLEIIDELAGIPVEARSF